MWSQQPRFAHDLGEFARTAVELGYTHVELSYIAREEGIEQVRRSGVPVTSLHAPAPLIEIRGRRNFDLNLAAEDEDERCQAVAHTKRTIEVAASLGARAIVVHLGAVEGEARQSEVQLRRLVREVAPTEDIEHAREATLRARAEGQPKAFAQAKRSLAELASHAERYRVTIGLEDRFHVHEIPNVDEALELLAAYPPDVVGYWHDVGHAEVLDRLGVIPHERWLRELGERCVGAHLHDVQGIIDHRAPGCGDADWDYVARYLPDEAIRTFEINQQIPDDEVRAAIPFLRARGIV